MLSFFVDLQQDYRREHRLSQSKAAPSVWVDGPKGRTREQIQAELMESMNRRQQGGGQSEETAQPGSAESPADRSAASSDEENVVSDYAAPVGEVMMGEMVGGDGF